MGSTNQKASGGDVVFDIYRDVGEGNFLNRVCKDKATDEIRYFCRVDEELHLTIYKGANTGHVIATAIQCRDKGGVTKIKLMESSQALHLKHTRSLFSNKTFFEIAGTKVHWKGQTALVEDGTGICLAVYKVKRFETQDRKLGTLLVTAHGVPNIDAIVSSALVKQERTDEDEFEKLEMGEQNADKIYFNL